ncbi:MAG TPA: tryptophan 2,3-dioxygenase family protein [Cytophagaceae bacterium]
MHNLNEDQKVEEKLRQLKEKYEADGQELSVYLEGLLNSQYLNYWDYIRLETLLSLQNPKTNYPDELIFITYHQITELYFKMVLHEISQLMDRERVDGEFFLKKLTRINWFVGHLISSFDIIAVGMEQDQFMKFRTALYPASGFQSFQYRKVEIASTDFINLVSKDHRDDYTDDYTTIEEMYEHIYWKKGAIDNRTNQKALTLKQFEQKYDAELIKLSNEYKFKNLYSIFKRLPTEDQTSPEVIAAMKTYDSYVNINWPLAHYKYALGYLRRSKEPVDSTGGTNWQKYLPPRFQKQIFFPDLYTCEEIENWGKSWVEAEVFNKM